MGFALVGFVAAVAAEGYALTISGPPSVLADRLLLLFCPPSGGSAIVARTSNEYVVWSPVIMANMFLYGLAGYLVGLCIPQKVGAS